MPGPMVRKQLHLAREQDRKLKALAARRGCTEAQVIRDALTNFLTLTWV
jgi:predicted DNA-binding protein